MRMGHFPQPHVAECDLESAYFRDRQFISVYIEFVIKVAIWRSVKSVYSR